MGIAWKSDPGLGLFWYPAPGTKINRNEGGLEIDALPERRLQRLRWCCQGL